MNTETTAIRQNRKRSTPYYSIFLFFFFCWYGGEGSNVVTVYAEVEQPRVLSVFAVVCRGQPHAGNGLWQRSFPFRGRQGG